MERTLQLRPIRVLRWAAPPLLVFAALLLALTFFNRSDADGEIASAPQVAVDLRAGGDTEALVAQYEAAVAADPASTESLTALGNALYLLSRETGDTALYPRIDEAFTRALANDSEFVAAVNGQATLALARHDFAGGLTLAKRARSLEPNLLASYPALIDAQVELGRYEQAAQSLDRLVSLKPTVAAYARISYFRELNGDVPGAIQAMRLAVSAGTGDAAGLQIRNLLAKLLADRGSYAAAAEQYRTVLATDPADAGALAGLAGIDAGRGEFAPAIRRLREVVEGSPVPEYAVALAETEEAAGRIAAAEADYALARELIAGLQDAGENADLDLALLEADHGNAVRAVDYGRSAWRLAPSVRSADALSWALSAAGMDAAATRWSKEAMKLGSRDPLFLYHAGMIARADGRTSDAKRLLGRLLAQSPNFNPLYAPRAERALEALR